MPPADNQTAEQKPEEPKRQPSDSLGAELYAGDNVSIEGRVERSELGGEDVVVVFGPADKETKLTVAPHLVKRIASTRIGAAPQLRTPVIEVADEQRGGVKVVSRDQVLSGEVKLDKPKTQEIPNVSPAARETLRRDNPTGPTSPAQDPTKAPAPGQKAPEPARK